MLTTKQKVYLRSLAQTEKPLFQIGREGLSDNLIEAVKNAVRKRELIKISVLKNSAEDLQELAFDLARLSGCELVQVIGRQIILYRKAKEPKILLP